MTPRCHRARDRRRGSALIEFAIVALVLFLIIFASIEFDRMLLVYTSVANAARAGARYAIVHGSSRTTGSGTADGPSGPSDYSQVVTVTQNYARASAIDPTRLTINVTYPTSSNSPGAQVQVSVTYAYDPFTWAGLPLAVNLRSRSAGIIAY